MAVMGAAATREARAGGSWEGKLLGSQTWAQGSSCGAAQQQQANPAPRQAPRVRGGVDEGACVKRSRGCFPQSPGLEVQ